MQNSVLPTSLILIQLKFYFDFTNENGYNSETPFGFLATCGSKMNGSNQCAKLATLTSVALKTNCSSSSVNNVIKKFSGGS